METVTTKPQTDIRPVKLEAHEAVRQLLRYLGEDPTREGLAETPKRLVKAWTEMTEGYSQDPSEILAKTFSGVGCDEMVVCRGIKFVSLCEHHVLPFTGEATIAYVPRDRVVGLSKLARLVHCFAKRLQIQERMTVEIAEAFQEVINPLGVGVVIKAYHSCMSCRGVGVEAEMVTSYLSKLFRDPAVKAELMSLARS